METRRLIAALRRGETLPPEEIRAFAQGLADGSVSDAQAGAFAMAVCLRGLGEAGRVALTTGMCDSGDRLRWDLPGPVLDKHSTGGVGDCVSLLLAPALAACGVYVPMISGRGLGHTGGTLDKLEAVPGLSTQVDEAKLREITRETGCAIVGATGRIAPADKRLYAVRDVTGTVDHVDLITASILSKKLAAGLEGLVLDVKVGSGAFMKSEDEARELARALVATANGAGCPTAAFLTDMDQPLAPALGNATEMAVIMQVLGGDRRAAPRLHDLTVALGGRLMALAGGAEGEGEEKIAHAIASGAALERFAKMLHGLGGPADMAENWQAHLPKAPVIREVTAREAGHLSAIDGEALGHAVVGLGGGRKVETDRIDPAVGLSDMARLGAKLSPGDLLARIHAATEAEAEKAQAALLGAITIGDAPQLNDLVRERVDP
ncbi:thymidine phosphorylase [Limimaricola litoreus]|uniref:Thymidine phosphorylase n=1 Tax=Limimaricola litoreus TaxID=2955316 RepID=A0A9X2FNJ3_9RHOB|nr:thymidine phosphorylase [Limimaricola litoreus]MCP1168221.1 thymidine phosphorylase [Limimaricola litoreus]